MHNFLCRHRPRRPAALAANNGTRVRCIFLRHGKPKAIWQPHRHGQASPHSQPDRHNGKKTDVRRAERTEANHHLHWIPGVKRPRRQPDLDATSASDCNQWKTSARCCSTRKARGCGQLLPLPPWPCVVMYVRITYARKQAPSPPPPTLLLLICDVAASFLCKVLSIDNNAARRRFTDQRFHHQDK